MLTIKVLGPGCANCTRLEKEVRDALATTTIEYDVEKVTDYADIAAYGILRTPGLVVNGQVVAAGRIPRREQIIAWATAATQ
jgi:small redox-active disulfide protein 2